MELSGPCQYCSIRYTNLSNDCACIEDYVYDRPEKVDFKKCISKTLGFCLSG